MIASRLIRVLCTLLALLAAEAFGQTTTPLRLGIMPFNSPVTLLKTHQPLIHHLEVTLGRPIAVSTSDLASALRGLNPRDTVIFNWCEGLDGDANAYDANDWKACAPGSCRVGL